VKANAKRKSSHKPANETPSRKRHWRDSPPAFFQQPPFGLGQVPLRGGGFLGLQKTAIAIASQRPDSFPQLLHALVVVHEGCRSLFLVSLRSR